MMLSTILSLSLSSAMACSVIDGDTIRCGDERIRLTGIDAPEMSHCRPGRKCVKGDPVAAKQALARSLEQGNFEIRRFGHDRYGRTLAAIYVDGRNVACGLLIEGHVSYVAKWDEGGQVARDCGL